MTALLMFWTARAAVACYLARWLAAARQMTAVPSLVECMLWTSGCLLLCVHMLLAFHVVHDWSWDHALQHTAERTADVTGLRWGGGLYINFAFAALWTADCVLLWSAYRRQTARRRSGTWTTHALLAFIVFNATVVFGPAGWWWVLAAFLLALLMARVSAAGPPVSSEKPGV